MLGGGQADPDGYARPVRLYREDVFNGHLADMVIEWRGNRFTHIEVKTGDEHLSKTFSTGQMLQKKYYTPDTHWDNFILLLSKQMPDWEGVFDKKSKGITVNPITWDDVAIALRRAFFADEPIKWKALARVFLGTIEQIIDKFKSHPWPAPYYVFEDVLRFDPDPDDFNMERAFEN